MIAVTIKAMIRLIIMVSILEMVTRHFLRKTFFGRTLIRVIKFTRGCFKVSKKYAKETILEQVRYIRSLKDNDKEEDIKENEIKGTVQEVSEPVLSNFPINRKIIQNLEPIK